MKAKILKVDAINNAQFNMEFEVYDDANKLLFSKTVGISSLDKVSANAVKYIKDSIVNNKNQFLAEQSSVCKAEAEKLVGQEFTV